MPRTADVENARRGRRGRRLAMLACLTLRLVAVSAGDFSFAPEKPTLDRWMYPFNFQPGTRPIAPTYGSFDPRFDTRDAQFLLGWDTMATVPTHSGPTRYLLRSVRVTLTSVAPVAPSRPFVYDPTHDAFTTYATNLPGFVPDTDLGRPIELYGVGYRGEFTAEKFAEDSPFGPLGPINGGNVSIATRNAYAAMFDTNGLLVDVANNVGQSNPTWTLPPFETRPWAVGTTTNAAAGEEVPDGATVAFDLDLGDPLVVGYLQEALDQGRVRLAISSLSPAGQSTPGGIGGGGTGAYPWWATKENLLYDPPRLELTGTLVSDLDSDSDGLPDDWERFWFPDLATVAGDDPDRDGSSNSAELTAGTDPTQATSVLRIVASTVDSDGRMALHFALAPSRRYHIESSSDLGSWTLIEGQVTYPGGALAKWVESSPPATPESPRFFRVRLE